ncbi:PREDICTED: uncharacterized protein LOC104589745 [Nelumbo nucifera]|uniref:Uncharacterized protein LOC104589745 n=2 Tax=Nelumbo nucifera TaxID=4432 RepID=A0A1U7ZG05_NELNU|nr:PREDICTED: uncharacterized protein LOC104589745 [Nelumbo nucifera]DAD48431.1 TPA_asm: hypothetical protein HUJ06_018368 [Nelumbo nucifera]
MGGFPAKTFAAVILVLFLLLSTTSTNYPTLSLHGNEKSLSWLFASRGRGGPRKLLPAGREGCIIPEEREGKSTTSHEEKEKWSRNLRQILNPPPPPYKNKQYSYFVAPPPQII